MNALFTGLALSENYAAAMGQATKVNVNRHDSINSLWIFDLIDASDRIVESACAAPALSVSAPEDMTVANALSDIETQLNLS